MSIYSVTCHVVACDECRVALDEDNEGYIIHFNTIAAATDHLTGQGWVITETGHAICPRCTRVAECRKGEHTWSNWTPCQCGGHFYGHDITGCDLFRFCLVDICTARERVTFANLPTIDEPSIGC